MNSFMKNKQTVRIAAWLVLFSAQSLLASTLTIGKGSGVVWQGAPFTSNISVPFTSPATLTQGGVATISNSVTNCVSTTELSIINGYRAYTISQGIGIVPIASANTTISYSTGIPPTPISVATLVGTIGLNGTQGTYTTSFPSTSGNAVVPTNKEWCLSFVDHGYPFSLNIPTNTTSRQQTTISGLWAIVTDGTQRTGEYPLPPMYAITSTAPPNNTQSQIILPYTFLRVTAIACSISTTTSVNFGTAARDTTQFAELASITAPLIVSCDQDAPDTIDTNINVQFSGKLYNSNTARLALDQGGGYITGEIGNGVTGSGTCDATTGVSFNYADINVGVLGASTLNQTYTNQITWRLCSGGATLPDGLVTASANVAVTYN